MKNWSFANFFALYVFTWLMVNYTFAILLPEHFANNPVVTQFTSMASNIISFLVGFYFGGAHKEKTAANTIADVSETITTTETK